PRPGALPAAGALRAAAAAAAGRAGTALAGPAVRRPPGAGVLPVLAAQQARRPPAARQPPADRCAAAAGQPVAAAAGAWAVAVRLAGQCRQLPGSGAGRPGSRRRAGAGAGSHRPARAAAVLQPGPGSHAAPAAAAPAGRLPRAAAAGRPGGQHPCRGAAGAGRPGAGRRPAAGGTAPGRAGPAGGLNMRQLIWLRSDLRIGDNSALAAAMAAGPTLAVYLLSPEQWREHDDAPCKVDFWLRNLAELRPRLAALNVPLLIRRAPHWRDAPAVLAGLCREHDIAGVWVNEEYGLHEQARDQAVARELYGQGVVFHSRLDQLLFRPGSVLTRSGGYFKVFSQFRRACHQQLYGALPTLAPLPAAQQPLDIAGDVVPAAVEGFATSDASLRAHWPAGEDAALARLALFADQLMDGYQQRRDIPGVDGTSRLSPYLAAGVLSPRQCLHAALRANRGELE